MAAISLDRFIQQMERLKEEMDAGHLRHGDYDQRLARVIQELRELGLDADRPRITATLENLLTRGVITTSVKHHLEKRLGLA